MLLIINPSMWWYILKKISFSLVLEPLNSGSSLPTRLNGVSDWKKTNPEEAPLPRCTPPPLLPTWEAPKTTSTGIRIEGLCAHFKLCDSDRYVFLITNKWPFASQGYSSERSFTFSSSLNTFVLYEYGYKTGSTGENAKCNHQSNKLHFMCLSTTIF